MFFVQHFLLFKEKKLFWPYEGVYVELDDSRIRVLVKIENLSFRFNERKKKLSTAILKIFCFTEKTNTFICL